MVPRKGIKDAAYVAAKMEDMMVEVSGAKTDVKSAGIDPETELK